MPLIPSDIPVGTITGQFYLAKEDGADSGTSPDLSPAQGTVTFTASVQVITVPGKLSVVIPRVFTCVLDSSGVLISNGVGVELPATNSPLIDPLNYTWRVDFDLYDPGTGYKFPMDSFDFSVPAGETNDLSVLRPVSTSPGVITIKGPPGPQGDPGQKGDPGDGGVPAGGSALQLLRKNSANTGVEWATPSKLMVGLGNVDNTSDTNKPVSADVQTALDLKADKTAVATSLAEKVTKGELFYNIRDFGAVGNGIADDTASVQAAVNAASAAGGGTVLVPVGEYYLGSSTTFANTSGEGQFPRYAVSIPNGVSVLGRKGAIFTENVGYANRRITFYIKGSNLDITDITIRNDYDQAGGSRPTGIPIGAGDAFDPDLNQDIENITIQGCVFIRSWYNTKFSFHQTGGTRVARNIRLIDCRGTHETTPPTSGGLSSGGYNFRSTIPSRIIDVQVRGCTDKDSSVSAGIGFYGVQNFLATSNICNGSQLDGAGIQTENGSDHGVIANNILTDHFNHVWLDDSTNITVSNNEMRNTVPGVNFKGVRITKQGYTEVPSPHITGLSVLGNNLRNCFITVENFGTPVGTPTYGDIEVSSNRVILDGTTNNIGINIPGMVSTILTANRVVGAATGSIYIAPSVNQFLTIMGNITTKVSTEASTGLTLTNSNAFRPVVSTNQFINGTSFTTAVSVSIGGARIFDCVGSPEGVVSAPVGSLALNSTGGASTTLYVKQSGTGATGWVAK